MDQTGAPVACPFCDSIDTELISLFGSQLLVSQRRCRACRTYFEALSETLRNDPTGDDGD